MNRESRDTLFFCFNSYTTTSLPPGKLSTFLLGLLGSSCCSFEPTKHNMQICKNQAICKCMQMNELEGYFASVYAAWLDLNSFSDIYNFHFLMFTNNFLF